MACAARGVHAAAGKLCGARLTPLAKSRPAKSTCCQVLRHRAWAAAARPRRRRQAPRRAGGRHRRHRRRRRLPNRRLRTRPVRAAGMDPDPRLGRRVGRARVGPGADPGAGRVADAGPAPEQVRPAPSRFRARTGVRDCPLPPPRPARPAPPRPLPRVSAVSRNDGPHPGRRPPRAGP